MGTQEIGTKQLCSLKKIAHLCNWEKGFNLPGGIKIEPCNSKIKSCGPMSQDLPLCKAMGASG